MPEIETMLREAIAHGTEGPARLGLAERARAGSRVRRRRAVAGSLAAALAVAGVVGGIAALGMRDGQPRVADDPTPSLRVESWRDASVMVPASWGYGKLEDACGTGRTAPVVERDAPVAPLTQCSPKGYGVQFSDGSVFDPAYSPGDVSRYVAGDVGEYPGGAWSGYEITDDHTLVRVVLPTREEVEGVLASFRQNDRADRNGCPPRLPFGGKRPVAHDDDVRLCWYGADGWLVESRTLTGEDARLAVSALDAAPVRAPHSDSCDLPRIAVAIRFEERYAWFNLNGCGQVVGWSGDVRAATPEVVNSVVGAGWSGLADGSLPPFPDKIRR